MGAEAFRRLTVKALWVVAALGSLLAVALIVASVAELVDHVVDHVSSVLCLSPQARTPGFFVFLALLLLVGLLLQTWSDAKRTPGSGGPSRR